MIASTGRESVRAFIPNPLPPRPPIQLSPHDYDLTERANRALGRLDGVSSLLPDPSLFIYFYVRKEALLSSQIATIIFTSLAGVKVLFQATIMPL